MTYREKLQQEQPEYVGDGFLGGCNGCPRDHFGTGPAAHKAGCFGIGEDSCHQCWDQEAPAAEQTTEPVTEQPTEPVTEQPTEPTERVNALKGKVVYIAGPITGVENYWEAFELAEDTLTGLGCLVLNPAKHPKGMTNAQYMRLSFSMIDTADAVLFLPGWMDSLGARVEHAYCNYIGKPKVDPPDCFAWPYNIDADIMCERLMEVLG